MSQIQLELLAGMPIAGDPAGTVSARHAGTYTRLLHDLSRQWTLIQAAERASFGWAAGLALGVGWMLQNGGGGFILLLPVCMASAAAAWGWQNVTVVAAADRLDRTYNTHELFGTAARLNGSPAGAWLAAQADDLAVRMSVADVSLARLHRLWWGTLFVATAAVMLLAVGSSGLIDSVATTPDGRFAVRGALLSSDDARVGAQSQRSIAANAASDHQVASESTQRSQVGAGVPAHAESTGASHAAQDAAGVNARGSGGHAAGPGAASSEVGTELMPPSIFEGPEETPGSAPNGGEAGSAVTGGRSAESAAADGNGDAPARSTAQRLEAARASSSDVTATPGGATERLHERRVPSRYRPLVRRYFAAE